jgi:hypothetical protein
MLEQRKNKTAEKIYLDDFLAYGIEVIERWLNVCVERGWVKPFDTRTTAQIIINSTLAVIFRSLHDSEVSGEDYDFNTPDTLIALKEYIRQHAG